MLFNPPQRSELLLSEIDWTVPEQLVHQAQANESPADQEVKPVHEPSDSVDV
jgi:hypothetical protein